MTNDTALVTRVVVAFALAFVIGFERELRGSPAGDRTFALVGTAAAVITAVTVRSSPQAIAGIVTGVGFIGGGVLLHGEGGLLKGLTTAAAIFATAGVGIVVGTGHLTLGVITAGLILVILELRNVPGLRLFDARRYRGRFRDDHQPPDGSGAK